MATLEQTKREYQHAVLNGMADALWSHAVRQWVGTRARCLYCGMRIARDSLDDVWRDDDGEGTSVCEDAPDGFRQLHRPDDDEVMVPPVPEAALLAARDLAKLYATNEGLKGTRSPMAELFEQAMTIHQGEFEFDWGATIGEKSQDAEEAKLFGAALANAALGLGTGAWQSTHQTKRGTAELVLRVPTFKVTYDGDSLDWEGSEGSEGAVRAVFQGGDEHVEGPNQIGRIRIINPNDANFYDHNFLYEVGGVGSRMYLVYASDEGSALEELIEWIAGNAPGFLADDEVKGRYDELADAWREEHPGDEPDDETIWGMQETAEMDTVGHDGHFLNSWEVVLYDRDVSRNDLVDIAFKENPKRRRRQRPRPRKNAGVSPAEGLLRSPQTVRAILGQRGDGVRCHPTCRGWDIFDSDTYGTEIEACDECNALAEEAGLLAVDDVDVQQLPEAQRALQREIARQNPGDAPTPHEALDVALDMAAAQDPRWRDAQSYLMESFADAPAPGQWKSSTRVRDDAHQQLDLAVQMRRARADGDEWRTYLENVNAILRNLAARENPGGKLKLTAKGERMYKAIEKGYRKVGEARAKEVAARTVASRVKQGARGLVKNTPVRGTCPRPGCGGELMPRRPTWSPTSRFWECNRCHNSWNDLYVDEYLSGERPSDPVENPRRNAPTNAGAPRCRECGGALERLNDQGIGLDLYCPRCDLLTASRPLEPNGPMPKCPLYPTVGYQQSREVCGGELEPYVIAGRVEGYECKKCRGWVRDPLYRPRQNAPSGPECPRGCGGHMRRDSKVRDIWQCGKCQFGYREESLRAERVRTNAGNAGASLDEELYQEIQRIARREMGQPFTMSRAELLEAYHAEQAASPNDTRERVIMTMVHG